MPPTMQQVALQEAKIRLEDLLAMAALGNDIIITKDDGSAFKIIPVARPYPKFGSAKGLVEMADDFDAPLQDFEEYTP